LALLRRALIFRLAVFFDMAAEGTGARSPDVHRAVAVPAPVDA
jgi:hypothetical protein